MTNMATFMKYENISIDKAILSIRKRMIFQISKY